MALLNNIKNWLHSLLPKGKAADPVAGMSSEQAAAYFAKKKADEAAALAHSDQDAVSSWPKDFKVKVRSLEESELHEWREKLGLEIGSMEACLGKIQDLIDSPGADSMRSLVSEITASHGLVKKFKGELKRLEGILKGEEHKVEMPEDTQESPVKEPETTSEITR